MTQLTNARLPSGLIDLTAADLSAIECMLAIIRQSYALYGFEALETPFLEYSDALGKFLPDQDRPNEGVFSFQDDDGQWLSLRYDLTAPLARYVAENMGSLPMPYRSFRSGYVFRNEKPGPGRFRQFRQFDADIVGVTSVAADAEMCMMAADTLESLGVSRGDYLVRVNNRKVLDGVLEVVGLQGSGNEARRLAVLRAIDKLDRLGNSGVAALLGKGRIDESGAFFPGAGLPDSGIDQVLAFTVARRETAAETLSRLSEVVSGSERGREGLEELAEIASVTEAAGYGSRIMIDPSVVRGLEYYTGPVFEAELTVSAEQGGRPVRLGSIGGGGRYDGLIGRFRSEPVPATGFSIGVSRLYTALRVIGSPAVQERKKTGPVMVIAMDPECMGTYQAFAKDLRQAGIPAEIYLGTGGMRQQMKYADQRNAPCVIIQGSIEREKGEVQIKDLNEGSKAARAITTNAEWKSARPAQRSVPQEKLVDSVKEIMAALANS